MNRLLTLMGATLLAANAYADNYTPDVLEFDGSDTLYFEPVPQFDLSDGGTLEFWIAPDWAESPDYDPIVFCNAGGEDIAWAIGVLRDRDGLLLVINEEEDVFPADFTDGRMHHVAFHQLDDGIAVLVDGEPVGTSDLRIPAIASDGLWVGSLDGVNDMFWGAVAGFRLWDTVIEQETLVEYAFRDAVFDKHPDLDSLSAVSDFGVGEIMLVTEEVLTADTGDAQ